MVPRSIEMAVPPSFFAWWDDDGLKLPPGSKKSHYGQAARVDGADSDSWSDEGSADSDAPGGPELAAFVDRLQEAIDDEFGGVCMGKLAGSAARDALFLSESGGLRCSDARELLVMCKGSGHVNWSVDRARREASAPITLVLREWRDDIQLSNEFRCFVSVVDDGMSGVLVAACQRDCSTHFPHLSKPGAVEETVGRLQSHFNGRKWARFWARADPLSKARSSVAVVDVCLADGDKCWVIDVQWEQHTEGATTDPLLFSWDELAARMAVDRQLQSSPPLRIVEASGIRPNLRVFSAAPVDFASPIVAANDHASNVEELIEKMQAAAPAINKTKRDDGSNPRYYY